MSCVIVGAGQAGVQLSVSLREQGYDQDIHLIGLEPVAPYQRPPLSKAYLLGKVEAENLTLRSQRALTDRGITARLGTAVENIDTDQQYITLQSGEKLDYQQLVLATGARNRNLPVAGAQSDNVFGLRNLADADRLRQCLPEHRRAVVIGAGFIGMEFAAVARQLGLEVSVVDIANRPFARALTEATSHYLQSLHNTEGVRFHLGRQVAALHQQQGLVTAVELDNGELLPCDLVLVGIGVTPNIELASQAGLETDNGIKVDENLQTSSANIYALGDCVSFPAVFAEGKRSRLESVQNAVDQARCLAKTLTGNVTPYQALPWFWSDQYQSKLQIAGLSEGHDQCIIRPLGDKPGFAAFCLKQGKLIAVETINQPALHMQARKLIAQGIDLTPSQIEDPGTNLKVLLD